MLIAHSGEAIVWYVVRAIDRFESNRQICLNWRRPIISYDPLLCNCLRTSESKMLSQKRRYDISCACVMNIQGR